MGVPAPRAGGAPAAALGLPSAGGEQGQGRPADAQSRISAEAVLAAAFVHDGLSADAVQSPVVQAVLGSVLSSRSV